ncbi:MAG: glycerol-3-phosphate dehydrogenase/oxidase, partial [Methanobacteriota archaeon]
MIEEFSARTRAANLESMVREPLDVLVIGGGIVGAWTALSASAQGYRTGLVERSDFASGTSGKTSRLVHGGLRYLQQLRLGLVREAARERDVLLRLIPDLVKPITFLIPVYGDRGPKGWQLRIGLWLYDSVSRDKVLPRRRWLTREEALRREAGLNPRGLVRAATYADAITSDARLVLRVVQTAASAGVLVANYASVEELIREGGRVRGARVLDEVSGRRIAVRATVVVNATGVWVGELQEPTHRLRLRPTKGAHILVPRRRIGNTGAVTLPTRDGRVVFVLPWGALSLVGTTDTDYRGLREEPEPDGTDVEYLLGAANEGFPDARLSAADVVSAYAGLRPLIDSGERRESDISRRHDIIV